MSTDQWDPNDIVIIRFRLDDGTVDWSPQQTRQAAEHFMADRSYLSAPMWRGKSVYSSSIRIVRQVEHRTVERSN